MPRNSFLPLLLLLTFCSTPPEVETEARLVEDSQNRLARIEGTIEVPGLEQPVEVLRDKWGVAHIYAKTPRDLFFAQGYVVAQDRLYQIEIWRRTGAGELAEVFGPEYVGRDRIARLVRYRGDIDAEWNSYSPDARQIAEAFTRGINAYVEQNRERLPIEFELLGFEPGVWEPEDVLLRIAGLMMVRNISQEIARAEMTAKLGVETTEKFFPTDPYRKLALDPDVDLAGIDGRVVEGYRSAVSIPVLHGQDGSNNWVVDGSLSATGKPLLASDPHRPVILPSLRYLVHLNGPGWNVIGSGEPALPGVAIGHNEHIGWGFTIVQYDLADLFVEQINPQNPSQYRYRDEWLDMTVEREQVRVKGQPQPEQVELKLTRHGPVIWEDPDGGRVIALRWAGQEPGTAGYLGSLALDRAQSWDGFVEAMKAWKVPAENIVYADVDGDIGWIPAGLMPIRKNWSGLLPVPGHTGKYDWEGFRTVDELPRIKNPSQGYVATANHNILPKGYPHDLGFDWSAPYRFQRVDEVLRARAQAGGKLTVEDFSKLQHDIVSLPARELVGLLKGLPQGVSQGSSEALQRARALLDEWDFVLGTDSAAAALFETWVRRLPAAYAEAEVAPEARDLVTRNLELPTLIDGLKAAPAQRRADVLLGSLEAAAKQTEELLGGDWKAWRWGGLHKIEFRHPLADTAARAAAFNRGPVERGGDGYTPNATPGPGFNQANGASYRHILDVADWDRSIFTSTPGQSGQPGSPHYDDLLPLWAQGEYAPLLFSREAVEQNTAHKLTLQPR